MSYIDLSFERITSEGIRISPEIMDAYRQILAYDPQTANHCARVAAYSLDVIDADKHFADLDRKKIAQAGLVHDIGKTYIAPKLLNKPGKLSPVEKEYVDKHAYFGYKMLREKDIDIDICLMVLCHHTLDALAFVMDDATEEIVKGSIILRAADIFDALTSKRPYRNALTPQKAIKIMETMDVPKSLISQFEVISNFEEEKNNHLKQDVG